MKKCLRNLRKIRVLGVVLVLVGICMFMTVPSWAANGISVGDSGLYIVTMYLVSIVVTALGAVMTFLG